MQFVRRSQQGFVKIVSLVLLLGIGGFAAWTFATLHFSYSSGERAGVVSKLSHKGWVCKTWEGEMLIAAMPGTVAEKFEFSVRDEQIAQRINQAVVRRQPVALVYAQHKGIPSSCFGETEYFIVDVKVMAE